MLKDLPLYVPVIFILTTLATLFFFYVAIKNSTNERIRKQAGIILIGLALWLVVQAVFALKNVYNTDTTAMPPKILLLGIAPMIVIILLSFATKKGRSFIDSLPLQNITWLNVVRIPIEFVLLWLALNKVVPQLMTFEGRNFDILSGITAPFIAYFGFTRQALNRKIILVWNFICLALLANIVINALLSTPFPFQQFAFDQPNIAVLYFPFTWLPFFIVMIVLYSHLAAIRQLINYRRE